MSNNIADPHATALAIRTGAETDGVLDSFPELLIAANSFRGQSRIQDAQASAQLKKLFSHAQAEKHALDIQCLVKKGQLL